MPSHEQQARTLVEALPYNQKLTGKTMSLNTAANAMIPRTAQAVMSDIILLSTGGNPGGGGPRRGPEISDND